MGVGRPKAKLVLTDEELNVLTRWVRRPKTSQLGCARESSWPAVGAFQHAGGEGIEHHPADGRQVAPWFCRAALGRLARRAPSRCALVISDAAVQRVVIATLESKPSQAARWSTRSRPKPQA